MIRWGLAAALLCVACDADPGSTDAGSVDVGGPPEQGVFDDGADAEQPADAPVVADAGADGAHPDAGPAGCNGDPALCDRAYDQVAYPTTHNSMASRDEGFWAPNHRLGIAAQLEAGVRGFMLDTYDDDGVPSLCHGDCRFGRLPLVAELARFRAFLEAHPGEVVTLLLEAYLDIDRAAEAFAAAGLEPLLHAQPEGAPWPTLGEMVDSGRRLVVFSDARGGPPWHHHMWTWCGETHWHYESLEAMDCAPNRGRDDGEALFILNHFITNPVPFPAFAEDANANPFFESRALRCAEARGHVPNFVTVDFWSIGALFEVVDRLNAR